MSGYEILFTLVIIFFCFLIFFLLKIEIDYRIAAGLSSLCISITSLIAVKNMKIRVEQLVLDDIGGIELYFVNKNKPRYKNLRSNVTVGIKNDVVTFHEKKSNVFIGRVELKNKSDDFEWIDFLSSINHS